MPPILIFDIETRINKGLVRAVNYPDLDSGVIDDNEDAYQRLIKVLSPAGLIAPMFPLIYHEPISIALGEVSQDGTLLGILSLGRGYPPSPFDLTEKFWYWVNRGVQLVSFNGRGFDLPVLELMALRYGIEAPLYWTGKNNARNRYYGEAGHLDLLDVLTNFGAYRLQGGLNALMLALGYSGKDDMDGSQVQGMYEAGQYEAIDGYCRLDVIRTYAVWLQLERVRGHLSTDQYRRAVDTSKPFLDQIR